MVEVSGGFSWEVCCFGVVFGIGDAVMKCQITMDEHMGAFDYLDRVGVGMTGWDLDDVIAIVEQVVMERRRGA